MARRDSANYFLALRITDDTLADNLEDVQRHVISKQRDFASCAVRRSEFHITLAVLSLKHQTEVERAVSFLTETKDELRRLIRRNKILKIKGVGTFPKRTVLFAKGKNSPELDRLVEFLYKRLEEKGFDIPDHPRFEPHITVMRISKKAASTSFPDGVYSSLQEKDLGEQEINNIHLCPMGTAGQGDDGFYICVASHDL